MNPRSKLQSTKNLKIFDLQTKSVIKCLKSKNIYKNDSLYIPKSSKKRNIRKKRKKSKFEKSTYNLKKKTERIEKNKRKVLKLNFGVIFKLEDYLFRILDKIFKEMDFYEEFKEYIEFLQNHNFKGFLDFLKLGNKKKF